MVEFHVCRLRDICASIDYGLTASASAIASGPRFLRITDIVGADLNWNDVPFVEAGDVNLDRYRLNDGDIVIARTGATTGESRFIQDPPDAVFASYLVRLRIKSPNCSRYVAYWLKSPAFRNYLQGVLGDKSAQPNASASTMANAPMRLPKDVGQQRAIASILGALDDKIELNRRMNETLEAMARAIFQDWFVAFGPTRAKMEGRPPYLAPDLWSLFPDSLDAEGKPKGWREVPLDQIADFLNGLALQKYPGTGDDDLPVIKIAELRAGSASGSDRASRAIPPQYVVEDGDVLFSWSGSLLQRVWAGGRGALNQHLFKVTSKEWPKWLHYLWVDHHLPQFQAIAASKATTMGHIQRHHLSEAMTIIGSPEVMKAADELIRPLFQRSVANSLESRTLAATRDLLLPRLMSGALRVKDAEHAVENAA
jgi:type I restriction enzyme S subunit